MDYKIQEREVEGLLILSLSGDVDYESLVTCFAVVNEHLRYHFHYRLIIDGNEITEFNISNIVCQQAAPRLFRFARRAAFFSKLPLAFGMMRVIHAYSFNENFGVFRNFEECLLFVKTLKSSNNVTSNR